VQLHDLSCEQVFDAWQTSDGLQTAATSSDARVREIPHGDAPREEICDVVHKAVCPLGTHRDDYVEAFTVSKTNRVLAAFREGDGAVVGGVAFCEVPQDRPRGLYIEFAGCVPKSHVGKLMIEQLQHYVKKHPELKFIALHSLDPQHKLHREGDQALHTAGFWMQRGFSEIDAQLFRYRLTAAIDPPRAKQGKSLSEREFNRDFGMQKKPDGTLALAWLPY
jgi:hypothetical protein